jgi:hypothetical protein
MREEGQTPPPWGSVNEARRQRGMPTCQVVAQLENTRTSREWPPSGTANLGAGFAILRYVSISRMCRYASSYFVPFRTTIPQITRFWPAVLPGSGVGLSRVQMQLWTIRLTDRPAQAGSRNTRTESWRLVTDHTANGLDIPRNHGWY